MKYTSHGVTKMDYARYHGRVAFLSGDSQRSATPPGLIVFDDEVRNYIRPSTRQGQLHRLLAGLEHAEPRARTDFAKPLASFSGISAAPRLVVIISDFYESPETDRPHRSSRCAFTATKWCCFTSSIPQEIQPEAWRAVRPGRSGNRGAHGSHSRLRAATSIATKMDAHIAAICAIARGRGHGLLPAARPTGRSTARCANILRSAQGRM